MSLWLLEASHVMLCLVDHLQPKGATVSQSHKDQISTPEEGFFAQIQYQQNIPRDIMLELVDLAIEIAREGREGRKIGTLFVVGDADELVKLSRCLILDPLMGHPKAQKKLADPNLRETVKELAQLDGGFIVSTYGHVISAARYFNVASLDFDLLLGLGTRHIAAASISQQTEALAVVVSESSIIRIFSHGELTAEILPEMWLMSRFSSHMAHPTMTEYPRENVAVFATESADLESEPALSS
jgi:DNA integrity scanning protein DisA with diadenylate cyclase activity